MTESIVLLTDYLKYKECITYTYLDHVLNISLHRTKKKSLISYTSPVYIKIYFKLIKLR